MTNAITVYGYETSNNMKVRVALGYKGLEYRFEKVDPTERAEIVRISGQSLTPVLVHGDRVIFDSGAILRYLDATFRDTPGLFGSSRDEQWEIEDWELFGRSRLAGPMMRVVHTKIAGGEVDEATKVECQSSFGAAASELAAHLADREWIVGTELTAADITIAAVLFRIRAAELFSFPPDTLALRPFTDRVMAFDRLG